MNLERLFVSALYNYKSVKFFKILRGRGVEGMIGKNKLIIGNRLLMKENDVSLKVFDEKITPPSPSYIRGG